MMHTDGSQDGAVLLSSVISGGCGTQQKRQRHLEGVMVLSRSIVGEKADCGYHIVTEPTWNILGFTVTQGKDFIGPATCMSKS